MRILVLSDSHGDKFALREAIIQQPTARIIYFLGDGERDLDFAVSSDTVTQIVKVKGNCDYASNLPAYFVDEVEGKRIYITHGYLENVKYTKENLYKRAVDNKASIALYGHTHIPDTTYKDGIWLVNPGSIREDNYAVVDITPQGIMPILMNLR
ncbi:MAG: YfcE family phosphodiesterase [Ruminococcus sp.]|nr:YfcE family phosphodiesterase [Candidatus Copronaster equi]